MTFTFKVTGLDISDPHNGILYITERIRAHTVEEAAKKFNRRHRSRYCAFHVE